jgi:CheY-like chemotaxis protein
MERSDSHREGPPSILVVDDDSDIVQSVRSLLERGAGASVATAASAAEAFKILEGGRVDLIVTDFRMPGMDGIEFLSKAARLAPDVPSVLITAFPDDAVWAHAKGTARVTTAIPKPVDNQVLLDAVQRLLGAERYLATAAGVAAGIEKPNNAPRPGPALWHHMVPSCCSTMPRVM